ncbi:MAG: hypothetical protein IJA79_08780 [Desulfovibrio sp.]|nr:hypothetical protein [Desulfovibrio sp.]
MWGMNNPQYYRLSLSHILLKNMIEEAFARNLRYVSFGSTSLSDTNLLAFKTKWKCAHTPIYAYYTKERPLVIDVESSYKFLRRIFFSLPVPFLKKLMPKALQILVQ